MRHALLMVVVLFALSTSAQDYVSNQLIVQVSKELHQKLKSDTVLLIEGADFYVNKKLSDRMRIYLLETSGNVDVASIAKTVSGTGEFEIAQVNHTNVVLRATPNDPNYSAQWSLGNGAPGRIHAPEAWDITTGGRTAFDDEIVVAVIDGGADLSHIDLDYFENIHDFPGNGIDDDNNGYVDDNLGWNAYSSNGSVPGDQHGTHVSGIVGAKGNNGTGVVGVNWNVKILPIAGSSGNESVVLEAYGYALEMRALYNETNGDKGAFVVATNSSFGVDFGNPASYPLWCSFFDSLGAYGILSAGATANIGLDVDAQGDIPTGCASDFMISVTNTRLSGDRNQGAAYGLTTIDLGAPGTGIQSTVPNNNYTSLTGTSMATPHVAGAIALLHDAMCTNVYEAYENDQDSLALWIKEVLIETVEPSSSLNGQTVSGGFLNLANAVDSVINFNCIGGPEVLIFDSCGDCSGGATFALNEGFPPFVFNWSTGQSDSVLISCAGNYQVTITDSRGFEITEAVTVSGNDSISNSVSIITPNGTNDGRIDVVGTTGGNGAPYIYQWSNGATGPSLIDVTAGTYAVTVTDAGGCNNSFVYGLFNTGVDELNEARIKIYPNPAKDFLRIDAQDDVAIEQIQILGVSGNEVIDFKGFDSSVQLDLSNLKPGLYFARILLENGEMSLTKVTKQ